MARFFGKMPSADIKKQQRFLASDGWKWTIEASDYGWSLTNSPGYETYSNKEDNDWGFEKNYEEAYQTLVGFCKRNHWTLKKLVPKKKPNFYEFAKTVCTLNCCMPIEIDNKYYIVMYVTSDGEKKMARVSKEEFENAELVYKEFLKNNG